MMQKCRIQLLGRLQFERGTQVHVRFRTQKTASLLAYLALHPGAHPRELLAGLIWPDDAPDAGRHSLRMALSSLRRQLEPSSDTSEELFESNRFAVGLKKGALSSDVAEFDTAIRAAHRAANDAERAQLYNQAVSLYVGPFLPGFYDEWCLSEARRLQGSYEDALVFLAQWHRGRGESDLARDFERRAATHGIVLSPPTSASQPVEALVPTDELRVQPTLPSEVPVEAKPNTPAIATLLAFDGVAMSPQLEDMLRKSGGERHPKADSGSLWTFTGATAAFDGAVRVRHTEKELLRLAICTGETLPDSLEHRTTQNNRMELWARALGMLDSAHAGQVLCCETTMVLLREQAAIECQDLGNFHLPGARPGTRPERVFQIVWRDEAPRKFAPIRAFKARTPFVPRPLSQFFGREAELATLRLLLGRERLITLSGTGGSGKTRLALQLAHSLDASERVVFWVPLADVSRARDIPDSILGALGAEKHNSLSSFESVVQELNRNSPYSVVLLLDNFEHLLEGGAEIIQDLLERAPAVQCLVTSRRVLGILGEVELPLRALRVPPSRSFPDTPESLDDQPSVRLFCDRARLVRPDFTLTAHNAPAIAEICRQLEGIPLALELAAARTGSLAPARILERLKVHQNTTTEDTSSFERFDFLQSASRTIPSRHRTLRAALDWSFEALSPELQTFFCRLWVFRGGCSVEAAGEVGETPDALDLLEELRLCSLLFVRQNEEEPRFRMLESVRQYALERASQHGEVEATRRRHAAYFLKWAQAEEPHAIGSDATARLHSWGRVRAEADNLRSALHWATEHDPATALRLAMACHDFSGVHLSEREMNIERALESVDAQKASGQGAISPFLMAGALGVAATQASNRGDVEKQTEYSRRRLELMRDASDPEDRAWALFDWGCARRNSGHFVEAREALEQSRRIFEQVPSVQRFQLLGWTLTEIGLTAFYAGDLETSKRDFEECEWAFTHSGDRDGQASAKSLKADILFHQGELTEAQKIWPEVVRIERELGDEREHPWRRHQEGKLAVALGELEWGHDLLRRALRAFWVEGHKAGAVRSLLALSSYWLARNRPEHSLHLLRVEHAERVKAGWPRHEGWQPLRHELWQASCRATSLSSETTEADFDAEPFDLATVVEDELRGFE